MPPHPSLPLRRVFLFLVTCTKHQGMYPTARTSPPAGFLSPLLLVYFYFCAPVVSALTLRLCTVSRPCCELMCLSGIIAGISRALWKGPGHCKSAPSRTVDRALGTKGILSRALSPTCCQVKQGGWNNGSILSDQGKEESNQKTFPPN